MAASSTHTTAILNGDLSPFLTRASALRIWLPDLDTPLDDAFQLKAALAQSAILSAMHTRPLQMLAQTQTQTGYVEESLLRLDSGADLPLALVIEPANEDCLDIRLYCSTYPFNGDHQIRHPLRAATRFAPMSGYVASYHSALRRGGPEACVESFEPDGYAREPAGTRHEGHPNLLRFYRKLRSEAGGVELHHLNVIDDGVRCVLEYNVIAWGGALLPPQAGVAVYERGQSGKLAAARIYDDVAPPPEIYAERD